MILRVTAPRRHPVQSLIGVWKDTEQPHSSPPLTFRTVGSTDAHVWRDCSQLRRFGVALAVLRVYMTSGCQVSSGALRRRACCRWCHSVLGRNVFCVKYGWRRSARLRCWQLSNDGGTMDRTIERATPTKLGSDPHGGAAGLVATGITKSYRRGMWPRRRELAVLRGIRDQ